MKSAILYIRVSTDEQADKGYSQRNQDEVLRRYCALKSIVVTDVVYEDHSAKTFNRPEWSKMLARLKKAKGRTGAELLLFTKWDRFSRNAGDAYQMISMLRSLEVEPQAIEQSLDLSVPENKMMLAFYLAVPEVENDRRALNIFHGMRRAKKEGRWVANAPVGYVNRTTENGRKYIRPSLPQSDIIKSAFTQLATGKFAIEAIWKQARQQGLACGSNNFRNIIRNPVYCGKIMVPAFKDEAPYLAQGQHEPLITPELFEKVQDVLAGKRVKGTKVVSPHMLPLRGFLACPNCGRMLTGSASKGRNSYYYYYHCSSVCGVRYKVAEVNLAFSALMKTFHSSATYNLLFKEIARDVFKQQTHEQYQQRQQIISQTDAQHSRFKKARDLLLSEAIEVSDFQAIKIEYEEKIGILNEALDSLPDTEASITKVLNAYKNSFLKVQTMYAKSDILNKRKIIALFFAKPLVFKEGKFIVCPGYLHPAIKSIFNISGVTGD